MSVALLRHLAGSSDNLLNRWLDALTVDPRIAWYPSAGQDFRDLLFLGGGYAQRFAGSEADPPPPNIFIHTDYFPWETSTFLDGPVLWSDERTEVTAIAVEELPMLDLPLEGRLVRFPGGSSATGRAVAMHVRVESSVLGVFTRPVVYCFVENAAFCALKVLRHQARLTHVVQVRMGGGCGGGGRSQGAWLRPLLGALRTEVLVSDGHNEVGAGDEAAFRMFPELAKARARTPPLREIRRVPGESWSGHGDVGWWVTGPEPHADD